MALAALPAATRLPAWAQSEKVARVAILHFGTAANFRARAQAFTRAMQDRGFVEGRNVRYDWRSANGQPDLLQQYARDLAAGDDDVVVSASTLTTEALREARIAKPVVMMAVDDPVREGFARDMARPSTNFTGITTSIVEQAPRFVDLLQEAFGPLGAVAFLAAMGTPTYNTYRARLEERAARARIRVATYDARNASDIDRAFGAVAEPALIVMSDGNFYTDRRHIVELAADRKLPTIYPQAGYVEVGGLMSFGPSFESNAARAATFVARVIDGEEPATIAIERSSRYELVVNRRTATTLKTPLSPEFLRKADRVIR